MDNATRTIKLNLTRCNLRRMVDGYAHWCHLDGVRSLLATRDAVIIQPLVVTADSVTRFI
jgi:hypothetical protein